MAARTRSILFVVLTLAAALVGGFVLYEDSNHQVEQVSSPEPDRIAPPITAVLERAADPYQWQLCTLSWPVGGSVADAPFPIRPAALGAADPRVGVYVRQDNTIEAYGRVIDVYRVDPNGRFRNHREPGLLQEADWQPWSNLLDDALHDIDSAATPTVQDGTPPLAVPLPGAESMRTLAAVVETFGLEEVEPTREVDRLGDPFRRYERIGPGGTMGESVSRSPIGSMFVSNTLSLAWALDVWSAEDGTVTRLRLQAVEDHPYWAEIRFVEGLDGDALPGPEGPSSFAIVNHCPEATDQADPLGWIGAEPWAPALESPIKVRVDAHDRATDVLYWMDAGVYETVNAGTLQLHDQSVRIMDPYTFEHGGDGWPDVVAHFDSAAPGEPTESVRVTLFMVSTYGYPAVAGARLDASDAVVTTWSEFETAACSEVLGAVLTIPTAAPSGRDVAATDRVGWQLFPVPSDDGDDTLVLTAAETCFDLSRGLDENGKTISMVLWTSTIPWREAIPDGTPPSPIRQLEEAHQQCLDKTIATLPGGFCEIDEQ